jgi:hypothetical protein
MKIISIGKIIASAILILGIIHTIATFSPLIKGILLSLPSGELKFMLYANLMCGSSFIIAGTLLLMFLGKLYEYPFLITPIIFLGTFLLISAILLIAFSDNIFDNPFAIISVLLNLAMFLLTSNLLFRLKFPNTPKKWYNYLG